MPVIPVEVPKGTPDAIQLQIRAGLAAEDNYVLFRETPAENHYAGGSPLPDWVPADV